MEESPGARAVELLIRDHRALDELFGRFLSAAHAGAADAAREAIVAFDERLRRHTAIEDDHLLPGGRRLAPPAEESAEDRTARELRLEHVQVRELSGMIRRALEDAADLDAARRLAPNLARRWDRHTSREEPELARLESALDAAAAAAILDDLSRV